MNDRQRKGDTREHQAMVQVLLDRANVELTGAMQHQIQLDGADSLTVQAMQEIQRLLGGALRTATAALKPDRI